MIAQDEISITVRRVGGFLSPLKLVFEILAHTELVLRAKVPAEGQVYQQPRSSK